MTYSIQYKRYATEEGWVCEARAVSTKGRIIARATARLAYDTASDLAHYLGSEGLADVERTTRDLCEKLVPAAERGGGE